MNRSTARRLSVRMAATLGFLSTSVLTTYAGGGDCCHGSQHFFDRNANTYMQSPSMIVPMVPQRAVRQRRGLMPVHPPPGTLGQTYRRPSRPVPTDKHPRAGMLDVYGVPAGVKVSVREMYGFRDICGVWHFESKQALLPGIPHVYTVRFHGAECCPTASATVRHCNTQMVRFIPGRIVRLNY